MSQLTQQIHELFAQMLHLTDAFDDDTPFIELGGQSILMGELKSRMEQMFQVDIPFDVMFAQGTVSGLAQQVEKSRNNVITGSRDADFSVDPARRFQPCPMTDLQTAYYIGRQADTELGGSPTRGYSEIICTEYDQERMTQAIRKLFQKHDVLRCCFQPDGTQQTVPEYDPPAPELEDISHMPPAEQEAHLLQKRERIFNTLFDVHQLPLVSFSATRCSGKTVIHFNHDGMIIDGWSHEKLIDELDQFYSDPERAVTPPGICFPDYVRYLEQLPGTEQFQADKAYWMEQAHSMYPRPSLPLLREPSQIKQVHTRQVIRYISQPVWDSVTGFAARHGLTPFAVLFTAFGKSILKYCKDDRCLINMPVAVRPQIHPEIVELIGECSNFFLFGFDAMPDSSFVECAARNQQKIAQIMQHNAFFGTDYIRALQKTEGASVAAPIVFTSLIDVPRRREISLKKTYTKTHTSQVWIDAIAMRNKEGIMLTMDCAADLFEESLTDSIGDTFAETLETIHLDPERLTAHAFIGLTHKEQAAIRDCTHADPQGNMPLLSELLLEAYRRYPEHAACIAGGNTRTYAEVFSTADSIAKQLLPLLSGSNSCQTAVFLEKGAQQLYAALACTMCNCAYFPLDIQMPEQQLAGCLKNAGIRVILTNRRWADQLRRLSDITLVNLDSVPSSDGKSIAFQPSAPGDIAYIINTSGTTGMPKSIPLRQDGLVNCLLETRAYCNLTEGDRLLAITNYCHDMSVFDLYGSLISGAAVVFPDAEREKDPCHWAELIAAYGITFWNSVPAFLEILLAAEIPHPETAFASLRNILTGGDWIPVPLAKQIRHSFVNARLTSVGGPSETTVWNIWHTVTDADLQGSFIPYGKPIPHTNYFVLDERGELCPPLTEGIMFVEGMGVTPGYIGLPEENQKKFTLFQGRRVYNTGDRGMYLPEGTVKILGRMDQQVKINGKRIELEGIQEVLQSLPGVCTGAVLVSDHTKALTGFYTARTELDPQTLIQQLKERLPSYMIPAQLVQIPSMPITQNGKVDIPALRHMDVKPLQKTEPAAAPDSKTEAALLTLCRELFENPDITPEDDFFVMGGNSITAIRLLSRIRQQFGVTLTIYDILNTPQINQWAALIDQPV